LSRMQSLETAKPGFCPRIFFLATRGRLEQIPDAQAEAGSQLRNRLHGQVLAACLDSPQVPGRNAYLLGKTLLAQLAGPSNRSNLPPQFLQQGGRF
jgi:hypothetical protein